MFPCSRHFLPSLLGRLISLDYGLNLVQISGTTIDLANGVTDPKKLVEHIDGRVKSSKEDFIRALTGRITKHHSFLIKQALDHICDISKIIQNIEKEIETITSKYVQEFELLQTVPGISSTVAAAVLAEIGTDMNQFPSDQHISSWAGLSPGSYESAGKKKVPESCLG